MTKKSTQKEKGLERLLADLQRGGWLNGLGVGGDAVDLRLDPATGACSREHFLDLVKEAVSDAERARRRPMDGPSTGEVAVLSFRLLPEPGRKPDAKRRDRALVVLKDRLDEQLRIEDVVGRTGDDTLSALFRGCPQGQLTVVLRRVAAALQPLQWPEPLGGAPLKVLSAASAGAGVEAGTILDTLSRRTTRG